MASTIFEQFDPAALLIIRSNFEQFVQEMIAATKEITKLNEYLTEQHEPVLRWENEGGAL